MSIIKSGNVEIHPAVRPFSLDSRKPSLWEVKRTAADLELLNLRNDVAGLTDKLAAQETVLEQFQTALAQSYCEGNTAGLEAGKLEAQSLETARLQALEAGVLQAAGQFSETMTAMERLAVLIAKEALDKILGEAGSYPDLLSRIVSQQIAKLEANSVLTVQVSHQDFSDPDLLKILGRDHKPLAFDVRLNDSLESGECRIRLKLGALEVGIRQQWDKLGGLLSELALPQAVHE